MNKTKIRFWGCRGSFPTSEKNMMKYGGDTSCVEVRTHDNNLIILDMGTGLKRLGNKIINDSSYLKTINIFLSHYHLDHLHGFLMFAPLFDPEYTINIYSRRSRDKGLKDVFDTLLQPEIWPVKLEDLPANISFIDLDEKDIIINDDIQILNSLHAHPNGAYSIKLKILNKTITYATDCEHPKEGLNKNVINFANDSDILIHDAQYTPEDLQKYVGWGHSSWENAVDVAIRSNTKKLILFHHSPDYSDDELDDIEKKAKLHFSNLVSAKQDLVFEL